MSTAFFSDPRSPQAKQRDERMSVERERRKAASVDEAWSDGYAAGYREAYQEAYGEGYSKGFLVGKRTGPDGLLDGRPPISEICRKVAEKHGFELGDLAGDTRAVPVVLARREACWECYTKHHYGSSMIGRFLRRDHSTVLTAVKAHQRHIDKGEA